MGGLAGTLLGRAVAPGDALRLLCPVSVPTGGSDDCRTGITGSGHAGVPGADCGMIGFVGYFCRSGNGPGTDTFPNCLVKFSRDKPLALLGASDNNRLGAGAIFGGGGVAYGSGIGGMIMWFGVVRGADAATAPGGARCM